VTEDSIRKAVVGRSKDADEGTDGEQLEITGYA